MGCMNSQQGHQRRERTSNDILREAETRRRSSRRSSKGSGDSSVQKTTSLRDSLMVKLTSLRSGGSDPEASTTSVQRRSHREIRDGVKARPRVSFTEGTVRQHGEASTDTQRFGTRAVAYSSEKCSSEGEEIPVEICSASADPLVAKVKVMELQRATIGPSSKCSIVVKKGFIEIWSTWSTIREETIPLKDLKEMEIMNGNMLMIKIMHRKGAARLPEQRSVELFADDFEEARKWYEAIEHGLRSMSRRMEYSLCQMDVTASYLQDFQRLVDHCFMTKATRDRKDGHLPKVLQVVSVKRVDNWTLFENYRNKKSQIARELKGSGTKWSMDNVSCEWITIQYSDHYREEIRKRLGRYMQDDDVVKIEIDGEMSFGQFTLADFSGEELKKRFPIKIKRFLVQESHSFLNPDVRTKSLQPSVEVLPELDEGSIERWLFHGTGPEGLEGITQSHFDLSRSGSGAGEMYGKGIYCAECSSKADEYTVALPNGVRGLILCRASLGKILYSDTKTVNARELQHLKAMRKCHTIVGDRWKAVGTYREYIFGESAQLYPEFIIYYRRVH